MLKVYVVYLSTFKSMIGAGSPSNDFFTSLFSEIVHFGVALTLKLI